MKTEPSGAPKTNFRVMLSAAIGAWLAPAVLLALGLRLLLKVEPLDALAVALCPLLGVATLIRITDLRLARAIVEAEPGWPALKPAFLTFLVGSQSAWCLLLTSYLLTRGQSVATLDLLLLWNAGALAIGVLPIFYASVVFARALRRAAPERVKRDEADATR